MLEGQEGVRVGPSAHGLGVFATRALGIHEVLGPIEGFVSDDPDYESDYCMELGKDMALEPEAPFRYLNHSCRPNCALVEFEVTHVDGSKGPELWVEIQTEIAPGEQMTIDYAWPADKAQPCSCGCPECRGWIVDARQVDEVPVKRPA